MTPAGNIIFSFHLLIPLLPAQHPRALGLRARHSPAITPSASPHPEPGKPDFLQEKRKETPPREPNLVCISREVWAGQGSLPNPPVSWKSEGLCLSTGGAAAPDPGPTGSDTTV